MTSTVGLTSQEVERFLESVIKANVDQLRSMRKKIEGELADRNLRGLIPKDKHEVS